MRTELVTRLSPIGPFDGGNPFERCLEVIKDVFPLKMASIWRYNSLARTVALDCRVGYRANDSDAHEFVHPIGGSLLELVDDYLASGAKTYFVAEDIREPRYLRSHNAKDRVLSLKLKRFVSIPFFNLAIDPLRDTPAGFVDIYEKDTQQSAVIASDDVIFIQERFTQIATTQFMQKKNNLTARVMELYSSVTPQHGIDHVVKLIVEQICPDELYVEACSLYEWSTQRHVFVVAATTGIMGQEHRRVVDFPGGGPVGETARLRRRIILENVNDPKEVARELGESRSQNDVLLNMEITVLPARSLMTIPIRNPAAPQHDKETIGVLRLVNKRCQNPNVHNYFSLEDAILAEEVAKLLAFHEDHMRLERSKVAFALHFGHEAQAPAAAIKGTAERLIMHRADPNFPEQQQLSLLQDIRDFSELLISFSDSITFGFADRSQSVRSRYRIRQQNLRAIIDQAKKVVIPICRNEGLQFNNIRTMGSFPDIYVDPKAFSHIFYNLFTNAIKYRHKDEPSNFSIMVTCSKSVLSVPVRENIGGDQYRSRQIPCYSVEVQDFGIGVSPEYAERIFVEGFRVPDIAALEIRGSGFGLSIVRNILADFGCLISVTRLKDPTTFRIFVPEALEKHEYIRTLKNREPGR